MKKEEYTNNNHVMLDIETLGTGATPVLVQLVAYRFKPISGEVFESINIPISANSCIKEGLDIGIDTVKFWLRQPPKVQYNVIIDPHNRVPIREAMEVFNSFLGDIPSVRLWGKGPSFDCAKLSNICELLGIDKKWDYWNERCVRTIISLRPEVKDLSFKGEKHNAKDDVMHQIDQVCQSLSEIINKSKTMNNNEIYDKNGNQLSLEDVMGLLG